MKHFKLFLTLLTAVIFGAGQMWGDSFALVTNVNQLSSGDEIIIVNTGGSKAMSTTQNSNNRGAVDVSVSNNKITSVTGLQVLILGTATKSNTTYWTLQAGSGNYLYAASSSSNYLRTKTTLADECKWSISLNGSNEATITSQGTYTRNIIKNNGTLFSCYSSGQTAVKIYKKITLSSIAVKTAPSKVSYTEGDNFDPTGLAIRLTYSDSSTEDVTYNGTTASDFTFSPTTSTSLTTSHTSVSITYGGKSTSQNITVAASGCTNSITINKGSESHGTFTLSESGPQATCSGLSIVVTPNAADHYHVGSVSSTTGETGSDNGDGTWTITYDADVTGESTINVVFAEDNKYTLNYHDGSGDDTKTNVYEGTNLITALGTPAASCDGTSKTFMGWSTTEIVTKTNTPPTFVAANAVVNSTTAAATYYAVYAKQGELESVAGGDIASGFGTTGLEGSHSDFYSGNGFKFKAANNYVTTGDISSNNYKDVTVKLKAGHNGGSGSVLTIASLDKDGNTIDSETLTPSEAYTSQSTTYTFELSGSKVIKEVRVTMTSKTNNLGMKYCEVFHSSLSDYMTTCSTPLGTISGTVTMHQNSAELSWDLADAQNGGKDHINSWKVEYKLSSAENWTVAESELAKATLTKTISNLNCNTDYDFRVSANVENGYSADAYEVSDQKTTQYTITLTGSGTVSGGTFEADETSACDGATITLNATKSTGYNFSTWTISDGSDEITADVLGEGFAATDDIIEITMPEKNIIVTAAFAVQHHDVVFHKNDGGEDETDTQDFTYGVAQNLKTISAIGWTRTNYNFGGWMTTSGGSSADKLDGVSYTLNVESDVDLFALWVADNTRTISYSGDTHIATYSSKPTTVDIENDDEFSVSFTLADHYTLSSVAVSMAGEALAANLISFDQSSLTVTAPAGGFTGNIEVTWTIVETNYTVNWFVNGTKVHDQTDVFNTDYDEIPSNFSAFTDCSDFTFLGWKEGAIDGGSTTLAPSLATIGTKITANKDYYAVFAEGTPGATTKVFEETFAESTGTAGWSGSGVANGDLVFDNDGWTSSYGAGNGGSAKFGGSSSKLGVATTPSISVTGNATLTFKSGAWVSDTESTTLNLSATGATLSESSVTIAKGEWNNYTVDIEDAAGSITITFTGGTASKGRFFLDDVVVSQTAAPNWTKWYTTCPHVSRVTLSAPEVSNGSVSFEQSGSAVTNVRTDGGADVDVDVVPDPATGYELTGVALSGVAGASYAAGVITIPENAEGTLVATATFSQKNYRIAVMSEPTSIEADLTGATSTAKYNEVQTITTTEPSGYLFGGWYMFDASTFDAEDIDWSADLSSEIFTGTYEGGDYEMSASFLMPDKNLVAVAYFDKIYSVSEFDALSKEDGTSYVIEGLICNVESYSNNKYITYDISDNGINSGTTLKIYKGLGLDGASFSAVTDLNVGERVRVYGAWDNSHTDIALDSKLYYHQTLSVESVEISGTAKTAYSLEDNQFSFAGLTATATYNTGYVKDVTAEATWTANGENPHTVAATGDVTVRAAFGGQYDEETVGVTYTAKTVKSIYLEYESTYTYKGYNLPKPRVYAEYVEDNIDDDEITSLVEAANGYDTESAYNKDVAGSYTINVAYETFNAEYTVQVRKIFDNEDAPHSVADATALIIASAYQSTTSSTDYMWVRGIVSGFNGTYNNRYYISDDGTASGQLYVFNGTYFNGAAFTADNKLKVGDEVILKATILNYNGATPELTNSQVTYQLREPAFAIADITAEDEFEAVYADDMTVVPTANEGDAVFTLTSGNTEVVTIVDNKLHAVAEGDAVITASRAATDNTGSINYSAKEIDFNVHVIAPKTRYAVNFDANGGSGDAPVVANQLPGVPVDLPANTFTYTNMRFTGWVVTNDATSEVIAQEDGHFTMPESTVTLTAQWEAKTYCTLTLRVNGVVYQEPFNVERLEDNDLSEYNPEAIDGYDFYGWAALNSDVEDEVTEAITILPNHIFTPAANEESKTLYAVFTKAESGDNQHYVLDYEDEHLATNTSWGDAYTTIYEHTAVDGGEWVLKAYKNSGIQINTGKSAYIKVPECAAKIIQISLTCNSSAKAALKFAETTSGDALAIGTESTSQTLDLSSENVTTGYILPSGNCQITHIDVEYNGNITYYTTRPVVRYTVTYDANGGDNAPAASKTDVNGKVTVTSAVPTAPENKVFYCWNENAEGTGAIYWAGDTVAVSDADVTIYATWRDLPTTEAIATIGGKFIINNLGDTAVFSRGNLQHQLSTNTWRTAPNQYEWAGEAANEQMGNPAYEGWVDLFSWSIGEENNYGATSAYHPSLYFNKEFVDWGSLFDGDWSTLSINEWYYMLYNRPNADNLWGMAMIGDTLGMVLLPGDWTAPSGVTFVPGTMPTTDMWDEEDQLDPLHLDIDRWRLNPENMPANKFTTSEWAILEDAGAVFCPYAGRRSGGYGNHTNMAGATVGYEYNYTYWENYYGAYWTSTVRNAAEGKVYWLPTICGGCNDQTENWGRGSHGWWENGRYGHSVRLVHISPRKYTVTYDANGATSGSVPTDSEKYLNGEEVTVAGKGDLKKAGYKFTGWAFKGQTYQEDDIYTISGVTLNEEVEFVAQWEELPVWATTYTSNVEMSGETASTVIIEGKSYTAKKAGSGSASGNVGVAIPAGATTVHFHASGWKDKEVTLNITAPAGITITPASVNLIADAGVSGSGTDYTLVTDPSTEAYFAVSLSGNTDAFTLNFANTGSGKQFVLYGVNAIYPEITLDPALYDFANVRADQQKQQVFTITANEVVSGALSATLLNNESGKFSVSAIEDNKVTVTFAPDGASSGDFSAQLKISASNASVTADLSGTAIAADAPEIVVNKNAIAFGRVNPNAEVSDAIAVQLLNVATVNAALSGNDAAKFSLSASELTADGNIVITPVTTENGVFSATLTLSADNTDDVVIPLSMTVATKWAVTYTSNVTVSANDTKKVKVGSSDTQYNAPKTNSGQTATIHLPMGTQKLHLHMVAWKDEGGDVTVSGDCFSADKTIDVPANDAVSGTGTTYTFTENLALSYYHEIVIDNEIGAGGVDVSVSKSGSRIVLFGVNEEGGIHELPEGTTNASTLPEEINLLVGEGKTLEVTEEKELNNLTVEAGGTVSGDEKLTVNNLIIKTTLITITSADKDDDMASLSGQIALSNDDIKAQGDVFIEITLTQLDVTSGWYAFSVPFPVSAAQGIYYGNTQLTRETDYAIMAYHEELRAAGQYAWKKYYDIMRPGQLYIIAVGDTDYKTLLFKKEANADIVASNSVAVSNTAASGQGQSGWNGLGNPNQQIAQMDGDLQFLDHENNCFHVRLGEETSLSVGSAFMYQYTGSEESIVIEAGTGSGALLAPAREPQAIEKATFRVKLINEATGKAEDIVYLRTSEEATNTYEIGRDLGKMSMGTAKCAQMSIPAYGTQLCIADFPLVNNQVTYPLNINTPKAGTYSLFAPNAENADIYLTHEDAIIWNLSESAYTIDLNKGVNTGYGLLLKAKMPQTPTGIESTEHRTQSTDVQKVIIDENVFILRGGQMYDVTGKAVK